MRKSDDNAMRKIKCGRMEEREEDDDNPSTKSLYDKFIVVSVLAVLIVIQKVVTLPTLAKMF